MHWAFWSCHTLKEAMFKIPPSSLTKWRVESLVLELNATPTKRRVEFHVLNSLLRLCQAWILGRDLLDYTTV